MTDETFPFFGKRVQIFQGRKVPRDAFAMVAWAEKRKGFNLKEQELWDMCAGDQAAKGEPVTYGWRVGLDIEGTGERVWTFGHNLKAA